MARAVHRVALLVLPALPERAVEDVLRGVDRLVAAHFLRVRADRGGTDATDRRILVGAIGPGARLLVEGGFARAWVDDGSPVAPAAGRARAAGDSDPHHVQPIRFVANRLGGFHADCAACGGALAGPFSRALENWRSGGPRFLRCGACGTGSDLAALRFSPDAGFARAWLVLEDVGSVELAPAARGLLEDALGGVRIVLRRG
jgi:hypothetical protein